MLSKREELELHTALSLPPQEALRCWDSQAVNNRGGGGNKYEEREEEAVEEDRESLPIGW